MLDWCLYGNDKREEMDRDLEPEYLWDTLQRYQDVFGEEFGVKELLMLKDIRVKAMIAGALADMPEFLIDQIGKANNSSTFPSVTRAVERIADVIEEKWQEERIVITGRPWQSLLLSNFLAKTFIAPESRKARHRAPQNTS